MQLGKNPRGWGAVQSRPGQTAEPAPQTLKEKSRIAREKYSEREKTLSPHDYEESSMRTVSAPLHSDPTPPLLLAYEHKSGIISPQRAT